MSVFVGLDCGGSSSRVLAVDDTGVVLFQGHSGAANLLATPEPRLRRNLSCATENCPRPDYVCGCFAGLTSEDVRRRALNHLHDLFPSACLRAEPDYTAAYYASPDETDVCVIAGTGSLVCSRGEHGIIKSGGRGYILGDRGSGFQYGRDALVYFLDHRDAAPESLRAAILELYETLDEGVLVSSVYRLGTPATTLARLAKTVGTDAKNGEKYAIGIVEWNAGQLAETVTRHVMKYLNSKRSISICLTGGLWKASPTFKDVVAEKIVQSLPKHDVRVTRSNRPPLYGAVELAKEMIVGN